MLAELVGNSFSITCDRAEAIGASIQSKMEGKSYAEVTFKRKDQIINLQSLYSAVKVPGDIIDINPLTLFLRLITVVERQPETRICSFFEYELPPYPMSLFKDHILRSSTKSKLKAHLLTGFLPSQSKDADDSMTVMDDGALLWLCVWRKGEKFSKIFSKHEKMCATVGVNVVVFDGYSE